MTQDLRLHFLLSFQASQPCMECFADRSIYHLIPYQKHTQTSSCTLVMTWNSHFCLFGWPGTIQLLCVPGPLLHETGQSLGSGEWSCHHLALFLNLSEWLVLNTPKNVQADIMQFTLEPKTHSDNCCFPFAFTENNQTKEKAFWLSSILFLKSNLFGAKIVSLENIPLFHWLLRVEEQMHIRDSWRNWVGACW